MKTNTLNDLISKLDFIDVNINATHLNYVNSNSLLYTVDAAKVGAKSWLAPYKKPQLLYHDTHVDAVGRVTDYTIEDKATIKDEPDNFVKLTVRITDKDAIAKVVKGIYYSCSVGSSASKVRCSHCDQILTVDGLCEHEKGTMVDGKKVYWIVDSISYKENSFVNNPADSYSRITSINIGDGWVPYEKFLTDTEEILNNYIMEDNMQMTDALSTEARNKLSDSVFCGPARSFPGHDQAHVTAGLQLLSIADFSESTKNKIKSSLYRKGKKWGIVPTADELKEIPDLITYRLSDSFSDEEVSTITAYLTDNVDADLVANGEKTDTSVVVNDFEYTINSYDEIKLKEKDEILAFCDELVTQYKLLSDNVNKLTTIETNVTTVEKELKDEIVKQNTILQSKEDEIKKLMKDNAHLVVENKKILIDSILDFKRYTGDRSAEFAKYDSRKTDSLMDTLVDFRNEANIDIPQIKDTTLKDSQESVIKNTSEKSLTDDSKLSKIDRFFKKNILTEE